MKALPMLLTLAVLTACGGGSSNDSPGSGIPPPLPPPTLGVGPAACSDGLADGFPCHDVSLRKRIPLGALGGAAGNDIWGWVDPADGTEYALVGLDNGTAFVDVSKPEQPVVLGRLPTQTVTSPWRDIKVYRDHAYIVADHAGDHGMQVFDLTRLRDAIPSQVFTPDVQYGDFGSAHNLAINHDNGFAYVVGSDTCGHGLHMIDLNTPNNPQFAGCHDPSPTHDTQCVIYRGPDANHAGREICFSSNEDHVAIVDVSDKPAPVTLATLTYPHLGFVHQGWLSEDQRFFLLGDESDELQFGVATRTHVIDVSLLDAPVYLNAYEADTAAIDHNLYVLGNRVFQANYTAGLRILEFGDLSQAELAEVAYFDTYPANDAPQFRGAWSVYPYLPSGILLVSDMQGGLFVLSIEPGP